MPLHAVVNDANTRLGTSAAYEAVGAFETAREAALPFFRNCFQDRYTTGVQMMNAGPDPATVDLVAHVGDTWVDADRGCPDCRVRIPPGAAHVFYPPAMGGSMAAVPPGSASGWGHIRSDLPVAVVVVDFDMRGELDAAAYTGIPFEP